MRLKALTFALAILMSMPPARANVMGDALDWISSGLDSLLPRFIPREGFTLAAGPAVVLRPRFDGARGYRLRPYPMIGLRWRNIVALDTTHLKVYGLRRRGLRIGISANYRRGRKETHSTALIGLGNIAATVEMGTFAEVRLGRAALILEVRHDPFSGHGGSRVVVQVGHGLYASERTALAIGLRTVWAGGDYMRTYFGVSPAQAAASGLPAFAAGAGFKEVGLRLISRTRLSDKWTLRGKLGASRLLGDAAASPIVKQRGRAGKVLFSLGLAYTF